MSDRLLLFDEAAEPHSYPLVQRYEPLLVIVPLVVVPPAPDDRDQVSQNPLQVRAPMAGRNLADALLELLQGLFSGGRRIGREIGTPGSRNLP